MFPDSNMILYVFVTTTLFDDAVLNGIGFPLEGKSSGFGVRDLQVSWSERKKQNLFIDKNTKLAKQFICVKWRLGRRVENRVHAAAVEFPQ